MKSINILVAAIVTCGMIACCNNSPKQFTGFISDATMNTVTVKALTADSIYTFSTEAADMTEAQGMLLGSPIVVNYTGCLKEVGTPATKVATDPTYAEAVGKWTMPDPINPDSLTMGFELMVEGAAQSINMATLLYQGWELQGETGKILLKGQSLGNGQTIDFTETAVISKNADGVYTLAIDSTAIVLTKSAL